MSQGRAPAPSVLRAAEALRSLIRSPEGDAGLAEIARATGMAKSSALAVMDGLVASGLASRTGNRYGLGSLTVELGARYLSRIPAVLVFERECLRIPSLRRRLVRLAMLEGSDIVYLARHEGDGPLGGARVGDRLPAASTAMGRALLASFSDAAVRGRLESPAAFTPMTPRSTRNASSLVEKLARVRSEGFAVEVEEIRPGVVGVGLGLSRVRPDAPRLAIGVSVHGSSTDDIRHEIVDGLACLARSLETTEGACSAC